MRNLQIYEYVQAVVEHGSIRKASEYLTISPSALNRQILAFEAELGSPIFERLGVGVRLSAAGEIYYRTIIRHLAEIRGANESVQALKGLRIGQVTLAISRELVQFLGEQVSRFRQGHPGVAVRFVEVPHDGFTRALETRQADVALIAQPVYRAGVETLATATTPLVAVTPDGAGPVRLDMFEDHDLILPSEGTGLRELIDMSFRRQSFTARPALVADRLLDPVRRGKPSLQLWPEIDLIRPARPLGRPIPVRLALCRAEGRTLPPAADRFAGWLAEALQAV